MASVGIPCCVLDMKQLLSPVTKNALPPEASHGLNQINPRGGNLFSLPVPIHGCICIERLDLLFSFIVDLLSYTLSVPSG